jgi:hypothetical protein
MFPIKNGLKQENALMAVPFHFVYHDGLKLNGTHQFLVSLMMLI